MKKTNFWDRHHQLTFKAFLIRSTFTLFSTQKAYDNMSKALRRGLTRLIPFFFLPSATVDRPPSPHLLKSWHINLATELIFSWSFAAERHVNPHINLLKKSEHWSLEALLFSDIYQNPDTWPSLSPMMLLNDRMSPETLSFWTIGASCGFPPEWWALMMTDDDGALRWWC